MKENLQSGNFNAGLFLVLIILISGFGFVYFSIDSYQAALFFNGLLIGLAVLLPVVLGGTRAYSKGQINQENGSGAFLYALMALAVFVLAGFSLTEALLQYNQDNLPEILVRNVVLWSYFLLVWLVFSLKAALYKHASVISYSFSLASLLFFLPVLGLNLYAFFVNKAFISFVMLGSLGLLNLLLLVSLFSGRKSITDRPLLSFMIMMTGAFMTAVWVLVSLLLIASQNAFYLVLIHIMPLSSGTTEQIFMAVKVFMALSGFFLLITYLQLFFIARHRRMALYLAYHSYALLLISVALLLNYLKIKHAVYFNLIIAIMAVVGLVSVLADSKKLLRLKQQADEENSPAADAVPAQTEY